MGNNDQPVRAEFHGLPSLPTGRVVTGLIPNEPLNFQTPAALDLLSEPVCVVTGPRGVGKTQVAAAYARQRARDGWLVAWIGAETEDQIKAGMVELADQLSLHRREDSAELTTARVRNHLQSRPGPALLVFDNVVSLDAVRPYLPSAGSVQVVITSTVRGSQIGREIRVDVFDQETALRFLHQATGLDGAGAAELAVEVGHLPLALAQAAAQIRTSHWDYAKYLENFRRFPAQDHLSRRDGDPHPLGAATAILLALEPFQDSELVELLAVLSGEGVSRQLLDDAADAELTRLYGASLVEFAGDSSVLMHRLVQRVIRDRDRGSPAELHAVASAAVLLSRQVRLEGEPWAHRHFGNELVRQIEALWANTGPALPREVSDQVLRLRLWAADFLANIVDFTSAALIAEDVYAECLTRFGEGHQLLVMARGLIARARGTLPGNVLHQLEEELARCQEELGAEHLATQAAARELGRHYASLGRTDDAVTVLERAVELARHRPRDTEEAYALTDELGFTYIAAGRAEDSIALLEQTAREKLQLLGPESKSTLYTTVTLAIALAGARRYDDAREQCEQVISTSTQTLGRDHPFTLLTASMLGGLLAMCGRNEEGAALLNDIQAMTGELLGEDHRAAALTRALLQVIQQD